MTPAAGLAILETCSGDLYAAEQLWATAQATLAASKSSPEPGCDTASLAQIPALQQILVIACATSKKAVDAATTVSVTCATVRNAGSAAVNQASQLAQQACQPADWISANGPSIGTVAFTGASNAVCLDRHWMNDVGSRLQSAQACLTAARQAISECSMQRLPEKPVMQRRFTGSLPNAASSATVAKGVGGGAFTGALVGVLVGLVADAPWSGAVAGAVVGGVIGGVVANGSGGGAAPGTASNPVNVD